MPFRSSRLSFLEAASWCLRCLTWPSEGGLEEGGSRKPSSSSKRFTESCEAALDLRDILCADVPLSDSSSCVWHGNFCFRSHSLVGGAILGGALLRDDGAAGGCPAASVVDSRPMLSTQAAAPAVRCR